MTGDSYANKTLHGEPAWPDDRRVKKPATSGPDDWIASIPELRGRDALLAYCQQDDGYRRVVMQAAADIWSLPRYVKGYRLAVEMVKYVYDHSIARFCEHGRGLKERAEAVDFRIWCETVSTLKNVMKNAVFALLGRPMLPFNEHDVLRKFDPVDLVAVTAKRKKKLQRFKVCIYCGVGLTVFNSTIDHVIPLARGGGFENEPNQMLACFKCNNAKGDQLWEPVHVPDKIARSVEFARLVERLRAMGRAADVGQQSIVESMLTGRRE